MARVPTLPSTRRRDATSVFPSAAAANAPVSPVPGTGIEGAATQRDAIERAAQHEVGTAEEQPVERQRGIAVTREHPFAHVRPYERALEVRGRAHQTSRIPATSAMSV